MELPELIYNIIPTMLLMNTQDTGFSFKRKIMIISLHCRG